MKLTKKQQDELWGGEGPYSEANIIIQTRIKERKTISSIVKHPYFNGCFFVE